jgi:monoamine oxidase
MTLGDWMRRHLRHPHAFAILKVALESVFAAHPDDISLLHALFYLHAGGGLEKLTSSAGGAQQDRVEGGMQGLAESWADALRSAAVGIQLEQPVRAVEQSGGAVTVHTDGGRLGAARVVSTLPPALSLDVDFRPNMSGARRDWCRAMIPGRVIKCFAVYDRPFWRESGLSGFAVGDRPPVHVAFDACTRGSDKGILLGFIEGREAAEWQEGDETQRRLAVLECFARYFGRQALHPERYLDHGWASEPWSRGCYAGVPGRGGVLGLAEAARVPQGRLHWAGTETATHWNGYIEGAIRSGERAAAEIPGD